MSNIEIRTANFASQEKNLTGYAVKWHSLSGLMGNSFRERFAPYAFRNSLNKDSDVLALWEHDPKSLLGRTTSGTLTLNEDDTGLSFSLNLPDTQLGKDVLKMVERGDIQGMSFGFCAIEDNWDTSTEPYVRTVNRAELKEITITSQPVYSESTIEIAKRSLYQSINESAQKLMDDQRKWWLEFLGV
ncbi:HK97 family phage prohead protease (plasmid) [Arsenophonus nasoniae]|nr:HK97 family phage prohead protease [Arsenophonus nasoniae]